MDSSPKIVDHSIHLFLNGDEGAQVVEYALIIAVVSIALVLALQALTDTGFSVWIGRVSNCLTTANCI